jgi:hypothetical protein
MKDEAKKLGIKKEELRRRELKRALRTAESTILDFHQNQVAGFPRLIRKCSQPPYELHTLIPKPPAFYAVKLAQPSCADATTQIMRNMAPAILFCSSQGLSDPITA